MTLTGPLVASDATLGGNVTIQSPSLFRSETFPGQPGNVILGNSVHIATNSNTLTANALVAQSLTTPLVTMDHGVASSMQVDTMTLTGPLVASDATLGGNVTIQSPSLFRSETFPGQLGNVILGNSVHIATNSNTLTANALVAQSLTTPLVTSETVIANGLNLAQAIRDSHSSSIRYYVKTTGDDLNDGRSWDKAFRTIKHAASVATTQFSTIYVESGDYLEDNPIQLAPKVSVIGDNLRSTRLFAQNPKVHYFFVDSLCYVYGFRFVDLRRPAFCVTFPCCVAEPTIQFGRVASIAVLHSPSGYNTAPQVIIESPDSLLATAPTATATLTARGEVQSIQVTDPGDKYPGAFPIITISTPAGIQPLATATIAGGQVTGVVITETGSKYPDGVPDVTILGTGTGATAQATLDSEGYLAAITVSNGGTGYTTAIVQMTAPRPIQATATAVMQNLNLDTEATLVGITVTEPGAGYRELPTVTVSRPESIQAEYKAILTNGVVTGFTQVNPGSGYTMIMGRPHISIHAPTRPFVTGSPYIQNCSSITGPFDRFGVKINKLPDYDTSDVDTTGAGGGMLIDGAVCNANSPLRSMVADSFTQVNQGGPGHLVIFTGYAQFVSCFTTFCTYSFRSVDGGTTNLSTSVTDFGEYGLVSTGYWKTPILAGTLDKDYRSSVASVTIAEGSAARDTRPPPTVQFVGGNPKNGVHAQATVKMLADRVESVVMGDELGQYESTPEVQFVGGGATISATGTVSMNSVNPIRVSDAEGRRPNQGCVVLHRGTWHTVTGATYKGIGTNDRPMYDVSLFPAIFTGDNGDAFQFFQGSTVCTGQHVMEYVGAGVTYNALLEYGGQPNFGNAVKEQFPGRVFYCLTDHLGNQTIGPYFAVEQLTGAVTLNTDKFSLAGLQAIGPFRRDGNPVGVKLEEVSNDSGLLDSKGQHGSTTVPTQFAVQAYVSNKLLPQGGDPGTALVKASGDDYDIYWLPVVFESEKGQPLGVANIDAQGRIVGNGSIITDLNASNIQQGTLANARLPTIIGTAASSIVGSGSALSGLNASNVSQGTLANARLPSLIGTAASSIVGSGSALSGLNASNVSSGLLNTSLIGTGVPSGSGNLVLSDAPVLYTNITVQGTAPRMTLQDTNHRSGFVDCDANRVYLKGGAVNGTTPSQVNGQWPFYADTTNNDCTVGGNLFAMADVVAYASDERLKANIRPISGSPLEDVCRLRGVRFEWRDDTPQPMRGTDVGLVAQDVASIIPEAVRPAPFDMEAREGYLTVDCGNKVTALLVEAVKELSHRLRLLEEANVV